MPAALTAVHTLRPEERLEVGRRLCPESAEARAERAPKEAIV